MIHLHLGMFPSCCQQAENSLHMLFLVLFIFSLSWRFMSLGILFGVIMLPIQLRIASGDRNCRAITPPTGMGAIIHMTVAMHVWWMVMTTDICILTHVKRRFKCLQFFIFNNAIMCIAVFDKTCALQISRDNSLKRSYLKHFHDKSCIHGYAPVKQ